MLIEAVFYFCTMANDDKFKKVISHAKEYGYVFQSSEIYDGLSAVYDYAQNGAELKKNILDYWKAQSVFKKSISLISNR